MAEIIYGFYEYTSCSPKEVTLEPGSYRFEAWGAEGGRNPGVQATGGKGGYSKGELIVKTTTKFFIHIGERGKDNSESGLLTASSCNGGGKGYYYSGGGGGSSDIRAQVDDLFHRILVAGGGGGGNDVDGQDGGFGGGIIGGNGLPESYNNMYSGKGGNQNTETTTCENGYNSPNNCPYGTFGFGGSATGNKNFQSGGGGGWFGGSGSYELGAGGGSGYVLTNSSFKPIGYFGDSSNFEFHNFLILGGNETIPQASSSISSTTTELGHSGNGNFRIIRTSPNRTPCNTMNQTPNPTIAETPFSYPNIEKFHFDMKRVNRYEPIYDVGGEFDLQFIGEYNSTIPRGHYLIYANSSNCGCSIMASYISKSKATQIHIKLFESVEIIANSERIMFLPEGESNTANFMNNKMIDIKYNFKMRDHSCNSASSFSSLKLVFQKEENKYCSPNFPIKKTISIFPYFLSFVLIKK